MHDKEEEKSKLFQLEQAAVKCMRGILMAMMGQRGKVNCILKGHDWSEREGGYSTLIAMMGQRGKVGTA